MPFFKYFFRFYRRSQALIAALFVMLIGFITIIILNLTLAQTPHVGLPCYANMHFGIRCPGCGVTRATLHLVRGDFATAIYYNPWFILTLAIFAGFFLAFLFNSLKKTYKPFVLKIPNFILLPYLSITIIFIFIRNFDFYKAIFY